MDQHAPSRRKRRESAMGRQALSRRRGDQIESPPGAKTWAGRKSFVLSLVVLEEGAKRRELCELDSGRWKDFLCFFG